MYATPYGHAPRDGTIFSSIYNCRMMKAHDGVVNHRALSCLLLVRLTSGSENSPTQSLINRIDASASFSPRILPVDLFHNRRTKYTDIAKSSHHRRVLARRIRVLCTLFICRVSIILRHQWSRTRAVVDSEAGPEAGRGCELSAIGSMACGPFFSVEAT